MQTPRLNLIFWLLHLLGWGVVLVSNAIIRVNAGIEPASQALVAGIINLVVCTAACLIYRPTIHYLRRLNRKGAAENPTSGSLLRRALFWLGLVIVAVALGLLVAMGVVAGIGLYFIVADYTSHFIFFWREVTGNWMVMTILILLWGVFYNSVCTLLELRHLERQRGDLTLKLKETQLNMLTSQLNPHFLFNGLNNIRALMLEDVPAARNMLTALSEILRYSLVSPKTPLQTLEQELTIVHHYIDLAQIQYESRLDYQEQIEVDVQSCSIPPMTIQLLVENAIRHGIDKSQDGGILSLMVNGQQDQLLITVSNPGRLEVASDSTGLGLKNIRHRLALLYGDKASFEIHEQDCQVTVQLRIPYQGALQA